MTVLKMLLTRSALRRSVRRTKLAAGEGRRQDEHLLEGSEGFDASRIEWEELRVAKEGNDLRELYGADAAARVRIGEARHDCLPEGVEPRRRGRLVG